MRKLQYEQHYCCVTTTNTPSTSCCVLYRYWCINCTLVSTHIHIHIKRSLNRLAENSPKRNPQDPWSSSAYFFQLSLQVAKTNNSYMWKYSPQESDGNKYTSNETRGSLDVLRVVWWSQHEISVLVSSYFINCGCFAVTYNSDVHVMSLYILFYFIWERPATEVSNLRDVTLSSKIKMLSLSQKQSNVHLSKLIYHTWENCLWTDTVLSSSSVNGPKRLRDKMLGHGNRTEVNLTHNLNVCVSMNSQDIIFVLQPVNPV